MRKVVLMVIFFCLASWLSPARASAEENAFETVFKNAFYGGLAGALVGGATLAFKDKPGDHLNYIGIGAAVGVIVGTTFGFVKAADSLSEIDHGRLVFHLPAPTVEVRPFGQTRREVVTSVRLLKIGF